MADHNVCILKPPFGIRGREYTTFTLILPPLRKPEEDSCSCWSKRKKKKGSATLALRTVEVTRDVCDFKILKLPVLKFKWHLFNYKNV